MTPNESNRIHHLIDRYFAGETSLEEEKELRRVVAPLADCSDESIREVRAILGYFASSSVTERNGMERNGSGWTRRKPAVMKLTGIAAAIAVATLLGVKLIGGTGAPSDCYAYVGNRCITDRAEVEAAVFSDLQAISEAREEVDESITEDFGLIRRALQSTDTHQ